MSNAKKLKYYRLVYISAGAVFVIFAALILRVILPLRGNADEIGASAGTYWGETVGRAIGTRNGAETTSVSGYQDGQNDAALQAAENEYTVQNFIEPLSSEKLQVFSADVQEPIYYEFHKDGDETKPIQYAAMKILVGEVYYSVDISQAEISLEDNCLTIILPQPDATLKGTDIVDTTPAAEYQPHGWSGNAAEGIEGFNAVVSQAQNNVTSTINQNETLMNLARESARTQVESLARATFGTEITIKIEFTAEGGVRK